MNVEDAYTEYEWQEAQDRLTRWAVYGNDVIEGKADPKSYEEWLVEDRAENPTMDFGDFVAEWRDNQRADAADRALAYRKDNPGA